MKAETKNTKLDLSGRPLGLWLKLKKSEQRASEPAEFDDSLDSRADLIAEDNQLKAQVEKLQDRRDVNPYEILKIDDEIQKLQRHRDAIKRALANIQSRFSEACNQAAARDREIAALRVRLASSYFTDTSSSASAQSDQAAINYFYRELEFQGCHPSERAGRAAKLKAARQELETAVKAEFGLTLDRLAQGEE